MSDGNSKAGESGKSGKFRNGRLTRRSALTLAGTVVASAATLGTGGSDAQTDADGYGEAGFGEGPYGGSGFSVITADPTDIGTTSTTFNAELADLDNAESGNGYFEWRRAGASSWNKTTAQVLYSTGAFSDSLNNLDQGTDYEYRAGADASDGDSDIGTTVSFATTDNPPAITTEASSNIGATSATLNASLSDLGGASSVDCYLEWRQTGASSWNKTTTQTLSSTGGLSDSLTNLDENTDYEYRAGADASDGDSDIGTVVSFTTTDGQPAITTEASSNIGTTSATLNASLSDLGGASSVDCYFVWRRVGAQAWEWNSTPVQTLDGTGSVTADVSGLEDGVEYEYKAVTEAGDGNSDTGTTVSLTTIDNRSAVTTDAPADVTNTTATLHGTLNDLGGASSVNCYFTWRRVDAQAWEWNLTPVQTLRGTGSFSADVSGLEDGAEYEYKAVTEASDGDSDVSTTVSFAATAN